MNIFRTLYVLRTIDSDSKRPRINCFFLPKYEVFIYLLRKRGCTKCKKTKIYTRDKKWRGGSAAIGAPKQKSARRNTQGSAPSGPASQKQQESQPCTHVFVFCFVKKKLLRRPSASNNALASSCLEHVNVYGYVHVFSEINSSQPQPVGFPQKF